MKSLYDALLEEGLIEPDRPAAVESSSAPYVSLTGKAFAEAVLRSEEFRMYIVEGLLDRNLPPAIVCRLMDHGWGKPPERMEHTGKDGEAIQTVTEVRRVILHASPRELSDDEPVTIKHTTH